VGKFNVSFKGIVLCLAIGSAFLGQQCQPKDPDRPLSPKESMQTMELEEGFAIDLVAAEPLVIAPVAMIFDRQARIWVAEMDGYMPDSLGTGEELPVGRIVILSDTDGDGEMDDRKIFLDSLVLPRAISLAYDGLLVAEPPYLWFYTIQNDQPIAKTLVDSSYAVGGNVEHQPNGLIRALDNWIYSAKSSMRYRRHADGRWEKQATHFRGQWGISQDNQGRLYYNDNSSNLSGDHLPPSLGSTHQGLQQVRGYRERIVADTRVYPAHPTTGVNRGYMDGILDSTGKLLNFTAACGPLIYRGGFIPGNPAFVAEPAANLLKRNELNFDDFGAKGEQAYADREFLRSTDERFRPVNLHDGPDGGLYVLDMYRGIIQHKTYLTPYLKEEIAKRNLTLPIGMGRIYRIRPHGKTNETIHLPHDADSLVEYLGHSNGWVRDQAQQALIDGRRVEAVEKLKSKLMDDHLPWIHRIHLLWTLEGLGGLDIDQLKILSQQKSNELQMQVGVILSQWPEKQRATEVLNQSLFVTDPHVKVVWAHALARLGLAQQSLQTLLLDTSSQSALVDAVMSGFEGTEKEVFQWASTRLPAEHRILKRIQKHLDDLQASANQARQIKINGQYKEAVALFQTACVACHGNDGRGISPIAPPLAGSHWVTGPKDRLIALVLYGMSGEVEVGGKTYDRPDISGEMPGLYFNNTISSEQLAEVLTYLRVSWGNDASEIQPSDIQRVRSRFGSRSEVFTQAELDQVFGKHR
jgi:mono/diheme cytochrome c family protein/glucose/arabinose dehydrogenase